MPAVLRAPACTACGLLVAHPGISLCESGHEQLHMAACQGAEVWPAKGAYGARVGGHRVLTVCASYLPAGVQDQHIRIYSRDSDPVVVDALAEATKRYHSLATFDVVWFLSTRTICCLCCPVCAVYSWQPSIIFSVGQQLGRCPSHCTGFCCACQNRNPGHVYPAADCCCRWVEKRWMGNVQCATPLRRNSGSAAAALPAASNLGSVAAVDLGSRPPKRAKRGLDFASQ